MTTTGQIREVLQGLNLDAAHEAGHAVASVEQQLPIESVTIECVGNCHGRLRWPNLLAGWESCGSVWYGMLVSTLAGPAVDAMAGMDDEAFDNRSGSDRAFARKLVDQYPSGDRMLDPAIAVANEIVTRRIDAIAAVAKALVDLTTLTGEQVERIAEAHP